MDGRVPHKIWNFLAFCVNFSFSMLFICLKFYLINQTSLYNPKNLKSVLVLKPLFLPNFYSSLAQWSRNTELPSVSGNSVRWNSLSMSELCACNFIEETHFCPLSSWTTDRISLNFYEQCVIWSQRTRYEIFRLIFEIGVSRFQLTALKILDFFYKFNEFLIKLCYTVHWYRSAVNWSASINFK